MLIRRNIIMRLMAIFSVIGLASCGSTVNHEQEEQNRKAEFPIIAFVENFVVTHPNFDNNDITRDEADKEFVISFMNASDSLNLIAGIPVKLEAMQENSKGEIMAQFQAWIKPSGFSYPHPIHEINFDVVGKIEPKYVSILSEDTYYTTMVGSLNA